MEQFDFKAYSELIGLIPPDEIEPDVYLPFDYSACGCVTCEQHKHIKLPGQSLVELELASRPHRWKKMRELQKKFYQAIAEEVVKSEIDLLKLLKLPDIDTIRQAEAGEDVSVRGKFEYTAKMKLGHERIVKDFQEAIVGDRELVKVEKKSPFDLPHSKVINPGLENAIFGYFMRSALGEGLEQLYRQLILNLPEGMTEADIDKTRVLPQLSNEYFAAAVNIGAMRIRTKISAKNMDALKEALKDMAKSGDNPMVVGRYLHKNYGELALWEWNRIARSESALMVNAAFDVQSRAAGVKYEKWSSAINACPICLAFDGRVWDLMSGPQPVECVPGDCRVVTQSGIKQIKDVRFGESVLSHNERFCKVTKIYRHDSFNQEMIRVFWANDTGNESSLELSSNHPVYIDGKWVDACLLEVGNNLSVLSEKSLKFCLAPITRIEKTVYSWIELYNLHVEQDESYIAENVKVHNSTHPHCLCIRIPLYNYTGPVQNPWTRTNPYDLRYSPDEIAGLPAYLNGERRPGTGLVPPTVVPPTPPVPTNTYTNWNDAKRAFSEFVKENLTEEDLEVINDYTKQYYKDWNAYLRQYRGIGTYRPFDEKIERLDYILERAPRYSGVTHRGIGFSEDKFNLWNEIINKKAGDVYTDNGFMSTSNYRNVSENFTNDKYKIYFEVYGKNGIPIANYSSLPGEGEVLFRFGSSYKLRGINKIEDNYFHIILEEL